MANLNGSAHNSVDASPSHANGKEAKPRLRWADKPAALDIIREYYATKHPRTIAAMIAHHFPGHPITKNMIISQAWRMGLSKPAKDA